MISHNRSLNLVVFILVIAVLRADYSPFNYGINSKGLEWFKDAKLGMFIHYAPVTQWGDDLSWPLVCKSLPCSVQAPNHTRITLNTTDQLRAHRQSYYNLSKTFNPYKFNATTWVSLAKDNGFKYIVYTSIHCDGFVNWNTKLTDYNIMNTPFNRDLYGELVKEARKQGIRIGAYVCPSIWGNNSYWAPDAFTALAAGCYPSYDPTVNTTLWSTFISYLHSLSMEILELYTPDIFWFDCSNSPEYITDTLLNEILQSIRNVSNSLNNGETLVMTRNGIFTDYIETSDKSENDALLFLNTINDYSGNYFEVPDTMQISGQWTFDPTSDQKNASLVLFNMILLTSKGGNYLLDISPQADGTVNKSQIAVLEEVGAWMNINSQAIYDTRPCYPYQFNNAQMGSDKVEYMFVTSNGQNGNQTLFIIIPEYNNTIIFNSIKDSGNLYVSWIRPQLLQDSLKTVELLGVGMSKYEMNNTGLYVKNEVNETMKAMGQQPLSNGIVYKLVFA